MTGTTRGRVLVTGGTGFIGRAVVSRLVSQGWTVRSLSRRPDEALQRLGVECHCGGIADLAAVRRACADCDAVIHTAAKTGVWGSRKEFIETNLRGTENILTACRGSRVRALVHTSSPSVVCDGRPVEGQDESLPYPHSYLCHYSETKALAEQAVLAASGPDLPTVALRPHLVWGPGDPHLLPRLVARARTGRLRIVGDGRNRVDATYIDNAADAHLLALESLLNPARACAGKAYFIANDEPMPLWDLVNRLLAAAGLPPVRRRVPAGVAAAAGFLLESLHRAFAPHREPLMTRFVAQQLSMPHWFNLAAAKRDIGYRPVVSTEEGLRRLQAALRAGSKGD
ncbi:MAG: NAD-dependent epimerase/dehydratase family protein [Candidatus Sumerlaeaceae bacterium]|nr:NAD-dependent epimerase/dehydratase family protein [Candidatus Sumerlaeaceae bacterium]